MDGHAHRAKTKKRRGERNMAEWIQAACCPYCGGELEISSYFTFSRDYRITKSGVLSKKYKKSKPGPLHCETGYCYGCERAFAEDEINISDDGTVFIRYEEK